MMTSEEVLKEVRANFRLEGIRISGEQEKRIVDYLSGKESIGDIKTKLNNKYCKNEKVLL